jgi:cold shock CspA family protein
MKSACVVDDRVVADAPRGQFARRERRIRGRVAWLSDGYGFIEDVEGSQYYFDRNCFEGPGYEALHTGLEVEFLPRLAAEGPQAWQVVVAPHLVI